MVELQQQLEEQFSVRLEDKLQVVVDCTVEQLMSMVGISEDNQGSSVAKPVAATSPSRARPSGPPRPATFFASASSSPLASTTGSAPRSPPTTTLPRRPGPQTPPTTILSEDERHLGWVRPGDLRSELLLFIFKEGNGLPILLHGLPLDSSAWSSNPPANLISSISALARLRAGDYTVPTYVDHGVADSGAGCGGGAVRGRDGEARYQGRHDEGV
ncbi:hypothetical protein B0H66DRAFT_621138 [Apodospora peruviana]|uniref:Uncharacterized protein n=1 Tax=Apodospora peruviana TaxID=516989 RepID=A0AAE0IDZ1_9PEZI|nr:hypothetical protein B0H66DRAFT_621138 [Apodospora peruviana]